MKTQEEEMTFAASRVYFEYLLQDFLKYKQYINGLFTRPLTQKPNLLLGI